MLMQRNDIGRWFLAGYETDAKSYLSAEKRFIRKTGAKHPGYFYNSVGVGQSDSYFFDTEAENCFMMRQNSGRFYRSKKVLQNWYDTWTDPLTADSYRRVYYGLEHLDTFHMENVGPIEWFYMLTRYEWKTVLFVLSVLTVMAATYICHRRNHKADEKKRRILPQEYRWE